MWGTTCTLNGVICNLRWTTKSYKLYIEQAMLYIAYWLKLKIEQFPVRAKVRNNNSKKRGKNTDSLEYVPMAVGIFLKYFYCISSDKSFLPDIPIDNSNILIFQNVL